MSLKSHIDNATGNQPGTISPAETALISEGVHDIARGDFLVSGKASLAVDVAKGEAFVQNDNYTYGSMDQKMFAMASSATTTVSITSNSSGNPRLDAICIKIDTVVSPGVQGVNAPSIVAVAGTPAATPVLPSIPSNYLLLASVAVANGATVTTGQVTDLRVQASLNQTSVSWQTLTNTFVYASADSPTFTMTVASTDLTGYINIGQKIRVRQANTYKYFIVTGVAFSTNTTVTIYGGTDYTLTNATIQEVGIATVKAPVGFPMDATKWRVTFSDTSLRSQASPANGTWYNINSANLSIPIGCWNVKYKTHAGISASSGLLPVYTTLSTGTTTESDADFTAKIASNAVSTTEGTISMGKQLTLTSKTPYYLNLKTDVGSITSIYTANNQVKQWIVAECLYL